MSQNVESWEETPCFISRVEVPLDISLMIIFLTNCVFLKLITLKFVTCIGIFKFHHDKKVTIATDEVIFQLL